MRKVTKLMKIFGRTRSEDREPVTVDFDGKTGADLVRALSKGPPIELSLEPRPKDSVSRDFSFDD